MAVPHPTTAPTTQQHRLRRRPLSHPLLELGTSGGVTGTCGRPGKPPPPSAITAAMLGSLVESGWSLCAACQPHHIAGVVGSLDEVEEGAAHRAHPERVTPPTLSRMRSGHGSRDVFDVPTPNLLMYSSFSPPTTAVKQSSGTVVQRRQLPP
jgi:hypothetical protein